MTPEQRTEVDAPSARADRPAAAAEVRAVTTPDRQPARKTTGTGRGASVIGPGTASSAVAGPGASKIAPSGRPGRRRTLVLAGGVAAAVAAIVAAVSIGNRSNPGPAANADPTAAEMIVMVRSTAHGTPTVATVTAQVSELNGTVVALVPDADGRVQQLMVVSATPVATTTSPVSPTAKATPRPTARLAGGAGTGASATKLPSRSPSTVSASPSTASTSPSTASVSPANTSASASAVGTTAGAPADPGEAATVVTGLTKLTGWVPLTTR